MENLDPTGQRCAIKVATKDRARPRPVDETGSAIVGRNTESHERNVSESTMFLTEVAVGTIKDSFAEQNFQFKFSLCENTFVCTEGTTSF